MGFAIEELGLLDAVKLGTEALEQAVLVTESR